MLALCALRNFLIARMILGDSCARREPRQGGTIKPAFTPVGKDCAEFLGRRRI